MTGSFAVGLIYLLFRMLKSLVISLSLTIVIEGAGALALGMRKKHDLWTLVLVNVLTNPVVVYMVNLCILFTGSRTALYWMIVAVLEFSAVAVEGFIYSRQLGYRKMDPWLLSLLLNAVSYGSGLVISYIL